MKEYKLLLENEVVNLELASQKMSITHLPEDTKQRYLKEIEDLKERIKEERAKEYASLVEVKKLKMCIIGLLVSVDAALAMSRPVKKSTSFIHSFKTSLVDFLAGFGLKHS